MAGVGRGRASPSTPPSEDGLERLPLGPVNDLAALPRNGLNQVSDFALDALAQVARVHRVEFPVTLPKLAVNHL